MSGGGVQHQQRLPARLRQLPVNDLAELGQLVHQVLLIVQPPGGVAQDHIYIPGLGRLQCIKQHRSGVGPLMLAHNRHVRPLGPYLQLVGGSGPEGIRRAEQDLLALRLQAVGQLADGGGLSHAVDADDQDHRGALGGVQSSFAHGQLLQQYLPQLRLHLLRILHVVAEHGVAQGVHRLCGDVHPHIRQDQGFLQVIKKFIVQLFPVHIPEPGLLELAENTHMLPPVAIIKMYRSTFGEPIPAGPLHALS